jgi:hypothetical protein
VIRQQGGIIWCDAFAQRSDPDDDVTRLTRNKYKVRLSTWREMKGVGPQHFLLGNRAVTYLACW